MPSPSPRGLISDSCGGRFGWSRPFAHTVVTGLRSPTRDTPVARRRIGNRAPDLELVALASMQYRSTNAVTRGAR